MKETMEHMRCLQRGRLPAGKLLQPSPASLASNRLALHACSDRTYYTYIASGIHTYQVKISLEDEIAKTGKDNLIIPTDMQISKINQFDFSAHRGEIQSVVLSEHSSEGNKLTLIGTSDSYGRIVVSCMEGTEKVGATYTACPQDAGAGEGGWTGLAFVPGQPSLTAVVRSFSKSIDFYDKDLHVRTIHTLRQPTALSFLDWNNGNSSLLAITEGPQLTLWDLRVHENSGCVQRILGSSTLDPLYAVCSSPDGQLVGTGGVERCAVIFDRRRWTALSRWTNCLKYEITGMSFSAFDSSVLYVHGLDYEVVCGRWNNDAEQQLFAFRGDSRWLGLSKCLDSDVMAGWTESGSIFIGEAKF